MPTTRPNVLFLISDQHNAKVLGHKGHPDVRTPHIDRLAAEGVRFDNAVTANPICTPSRVSFLSGQYCHNHGYYGLSGPNPGGLPNLFVHLRRYGYATAAMGKIHCPADWVEDDCDVFHETVGCSRDGQSKAYAKFLIDQGVDHLEDHQALPEFGGRGRQKMDGRRSPLTFEQSQEGWIADTAIDFMKGAQANDQPFVIQASFPRPHQCATPSEPFWSWYEGRELTVPPNAEYDLKAAGKAPHLIAMHEHWKEHDWFHFEPKTYEAARYRKMRSYLGAVSQVDAAVGKMLEHLDAAGLAENTVVIYTSDHGDYYTEHGIMEKAPGICADAITRIPFIWRAPGTTQAGHVERQVVNSVDLTQTVCALAGVPAMQTSDGRDLTPLLGGQAAPDDAAIGVTEFAWSKSIRKGKYRFVYYPREMFPDEYPQGFGELYDIEADPWEMTNLCFDGAHAPVVEELRADLMNWLITTTRPTTMLGIDAEEGTFQSKRRYQHVVNHDGKIDPKLIEQSTRRNYV